VQRQGLLRAVALAGIQLSDQPGGAARPHLPLFEEAAELRADRAGLWFPEVAVGAEVAQGTRLGRLEDAFGDEVHEILAPAAGVLTYGLASLAAGPGDLLASLSRPA
jgi:predicted deacylase